jgi:hypothetical protein
MGIFSSKREFLEPGRVSWMSAAYTVTSNCFTDNPYEFWGTFLYKIDGLRNLEMPVFCHESEGKLYFIKFKEVTVKRER